MIAACQFVKIIYNRSGLFWGTPASTLDTNIKSKLISEIVINLGKLTGPVSEIYTETPGDTSEFEKIIYF